MPPRTPTVPVQSSLTVKRLLLQSFDLTTLQKRGLPHPSRDRFVKVPQEFWVLLACESHAVSQVVFEVMRLTIGYVDKAAACGYREWVALSYRHFERMGIMSKNVAQRSLNYAIQHGYLLARKGKRSSWEYAIRWQSPGDIVTP